MVNLKKMSFLGILFQEFFSFIKKTIMTNEQIETLKIINGALDEVWTEPLMLKIEE